MLIALFKGSGPVSWLIKKQTRSPYSHAALILSDGRCLEAWHNPSGVRVGPMDVLHPKANADFFRVVLPDSMDRELERWALSQVGKKYDYTSVLRFVTRRQETRRSTGRWFCSELVFAGYHRMGVRLLERIEPWAVCPGRLSLSPLLLPSHSQ
jgi:uncharacterized protein YycO